MASRTCLPASEYNAISDAACEFVALAVQDFLRGQSLPQVVRGPIAPLVPGCHPWSPDAACRRRRQPEAGFPVC
jgi:hypothetical protein